VVIDDERNWGFAQHWHADYLRSTVGDSEVAVREANGPPRNIFQNLAEGGRIPFPDYLDWVLDTGEQLRPILQRCNDVAGITRAVCASGLECSYYLDVKLEELSRTLRGEVRAPEWYRAPPMDVNFWCGVLGTSSGLHCDVTPNCNVQVTGQKHFILFPPSQSRAVYQVPGITHCRFDPNVPDFDRFPLAKHAQGWQCRLQPGESLYIPVGWFHQVTVVSEWAVNVNFFWRRPFPQGLLQPRLWRFLCRRQRAKLARKFRRPKIQRSTSVSLDHSVPD
jgi:hypothetical protein